MRSRSIIHAQFTLYFARSSVPICPVEGFRRRRVMTARPDWMAAALVAADSVQIDWLFLCA